MRYPAIGDSIRAMPASKAGWFFQERIRKLVAECVVQDRDVATALKRLCELEDDGSLTPYGLRMVAALKIHSQAADEAIERLSRSIERRVDDEDPHDRRVEMYLRAATQLELGDPDSSLVGLDELLEELPDDAGLRCDCHHTRGVALEARGDRDEALVSYRACLELSDDYDTPHVRLDIARVLSESDTDEAIATLEESLADASYGSAWGETPYALARLHAKQGNAERAAEALARAVEAARDAEAMRRRAREDVTFAELRSQASFASATTEPSVDVAWLGGPLAALGDHAGLRELGLRLVDEERGREGGDELRGHYAEGLHLGTLWTDGLWGACQQVAAPLTLIATGPRVPGQRHAGELTHEILLYADLDAPEHVWLGPSTSFPAALFTRVPSDPESVANALRQLFVEVPRSVAELTGERRAFMGYLRQLAVPNPYSGGMEEAGPHELERHFNFSPAADPLTWGGAHADDPWPDVMPSVPPFRLIGLTRERRSQLRGSIARILRRTQFSRSHLGYEIHQARGNPKYVWHLRYRPNPYPDTIERFNTMAGYDYPSDLPADVVAAMVGFDWMTTERVESFLEGAEPPMVAEVAEILAALSHNELFIVDRLRALAARDDLGPGERGRIAQLCIEYGWLALLQELALVEPDRELRSNMMRVLRAGLAEPTYNEMGEPQGLYGEGDEYDDDDYDDYDDEEDDE